MVTISLSTTLMATGYQATVTFPDGVSVSSVEIYSSQSEAVTAAAAKLLEMPGRISALDLPSNKLDKQGRA